MKLADLITQAQEKGTLILAYQPLSEEAKIELSLHNLVAEAINTSSGQALLITYQKNFSPSHAPLASYEVIEIHLTFHERFAFTLEQIHEWEKSLASAFSQDPKFVRIIGSLPTEENRRYPMLKIFAVFWVESNREPVVSFAVKRLCVKEYMQQNRLEEKITFSVYEHFTLEFEVEMTSKSEKAVKNLIPGLKAGLKDSSRPYNHLFKEDLELKGVLSGNKMYNLYLSATLSLDPEGDPVKNLFEIRFALKQLLCLTLEQQNIGYKVIQHVG